MSKEGKKERREGDKKVNDSIPFKLESLITP